MFITRRRLEEMLKEKEEKIRNEYEREERRREEERWRAERLRELEKRIFMLEDKLNPPVTGTCNKSIN